MEPMVERQIDLDAPPEEVWDAVSSPETWLADSGELPLEPGAVGHLVEDGRGRTAVVEEVEDGRRLVYRWWDDDAPPVLEVVSGPDGPGSVGGPAGASRVEITLVGVDGGTRVVVREWAIAPTLDARGVVVPVDGLGWDRRFTWLSFGASSRALVGA
jgi:uncharacterized protein YndB with AHSA1/START domain